MDRPPAAEREIAHPKIWPDLMKLRYFVGFYRFGWDFRLSLHIFAPNLRTTMTVNPSKYLLAAVFALNISIFPNVTYAQHESGHATPQSHDEHAAGGHEEKKEGFDANEVIFSHIMDAHEYHFLDITDEKGEKHPIGIPLPVILYQEGKGWSVFMSSKFHHGHTVHEGYRMLDRHFMHEHGLDTMKTAGGTPVFKAGQIYSVDEAGMPLADVQVYDVSLTRNVTQMILALILLTWILVSMAGKYRQQGKKAPSGLQNAIEPVITFVRDEVAKPNLGHKYEKYLPYLLTVFFFILINNIFGLIPGSANVTGNIAFTMVFALISFIVIILSANKHFWAHIFNPPVPGFVKGILVPVEILGIFTKPFALMIRLFANMMAGHIIIICLVSLIFIFGSLSKGIGWGFSPVSIAFASFIYVIEIMVAFIQAFIFTNLTAVFIGQSMEGDHHEEGHH
jgi:F-type H+-transporting ATPase subunit a